jgi:DNA-binding XRE family transcriptional regulator
VSAAASNVYVLKSDHGLVKVGISKNPEKRAKDLRSHSGLVIDLAYARELENAGSVERAAHIILDAKRRNGEWFDVTVEEAISAIDLAVEGLPRSELFEKDSPCSAAQCRMARAALRWTTKDLAKRARIDGNTVIRFENGKRKSNETTMLVIKQAFEAAGLIFIDADETAGAGVRVKEASE